RIRITKRIGDIFAAPPNTVLIHACNAVGSWGGGIALAFRNHYPSEFRIYRAHCARSAPDRLVGTALLISPQRESRNDTGRGHYIGCLFTSRSHGTAKDPPESILQATAPAMRHLMRLIVEKEVRTGVGIGQLRMCKINSGLFAVPWARSKRAIEEMELGEGEVPACAEGGVVQVVVYER
ncbi:ADP-ribose 1''-phosphate phosphatase, partial [Parathielavia appendiculata]